MALSLSIGNSYNNGRGVDFDETKARYYYGLSAMMGDATARHNLGIIEQKAGNIGRAVRHYEIAAGSGLSESLETIQKMYLYGHATKEDYSKALQSYQTYLEKIKSDHRDKAAAADEQYHYY